MNSSRRILLLITDLEIGGTPIVVRELAIRLSARHPSAKIEVACLSKSGPIADQLRAAGIGVTAFEARGTLDLFRVAMRLHRLIREHRIDTVFSFLVHANFVAAIASLANRNVRFVQSIQTTQPRPRWHWRVQAIAQLAAERVIVPSPSAARVAHERSGVALSKLVVIPNAVDVDSFQPSAASAIPPSPFPIGFIGRLDPVKRVPLLVQQFAKLSRQIDRPIHLSIFGDGPERARIGEEMSRSGVQNQITLNATMGNARHALDRIAMLVLPSEAEGFGLVLIEAMAASVPIVACDVPGVCDVVEHERTGLLARADGSNLAELMQQMIVDESLRASAIRAGRKEVAHRYDWTSVLPMYDQLLLR